jgi:hypothetical protein
MKWLLAVIAGIAMRDGNNGFGATGEGDELQCDEGSEEEFAEVHGCRFPLVE